MLNEPVDVLIVGSGASGAALAWSLYETRMHILCMEQGPWVNTQDYPSTQPDYELHRYAEFSCDPNVRQLPQDYPIVELKTGCRVREITVKPDGMADGVLYYDQDGQLQEQKAEVVVLACNGVGTPRLMLNSTSNLFLDGIANSSGMVGKT